ncbi:hypothetical protein RHGRI_009719 [Rhododendron griersonianum]|uniref:Transposase, Ptta/En/Spm, plant n=1 Tax=Rhododendron griersonianum TaxID=479676 RepID=A0AAV6KFU2_9ERIC|nr:hypothetical protein RHGRI_009719 [Rhododendron griersonianum]
MSKSDKQWVKPGDLAKQKQNGYKRKRNNNVKENENEYQRMRDNKIKENEKRVQAMGFKHVPAFVHYVPMKRNGKLIMAGADDDSSPGNEDDSDNDSDQSDDSFEQEVVRIQVVPEMQPGTSHLQRAPTRNQHGASPIRERVTRSTPHPDVGTQPPQPLDAEQEIQAAPFVAPVVADRPIRGPTRGLMVQQLFDKEGKLLVPIPQCFRAPVGKYACKLATQIGVEVRTNLEDLTIRRWKAVDESVKAPMFQRIKDRFNLEGDPIDVEKAVARQFGRRLSDYTHDLYKKYKKLKSTKGVEYARSHPPSGVTHEQWMGLIDKKWSDTKFQNKSTKNIKNRTEMKSKHRCGSKSIPVRVNAMMQTNGNRVPDLKEVYKSTHFNEDTKMWISEESEKNYGKIIEVEAEHAEAGVTPITQEELSIKSLKAKSGYVKGLGMRPSSSLRTTVASAANSQYVSHLESLVQEYQEERQAQQQKIDVLSESNKQMELTTATIMEYLKHQGNGFSEYIENSRST